MHSDCIIWTGEVNNNGYGPHREVYKKHYGVLDPNLDVMHKCDVKRCINPLHLEQGTHSRNQRDARDRGLTPTKLDAIMVDEIRRRYKEENITQTKLAIEYNVTRQTINHVVNHITWRN